MPDATTIALADAIVSSLNGGTFDLSFTAVRSFLPLYDLEDLATLRVTVVPSAVADELLNRSQVTREEHLVEIGVQKKVATDHSDVPGLVKLCQDFKTHLRGVNGLTVDDQRMAMTESVVDPLYIPQHLKERSTFTAVMRAVFRTVRA